MCSGMTFGGHHPPANYVLLLFLHQRHAEWIRDNAVRDPLIVQWSASNKISWDFEEYSSDFGALSESADCLLSEMLAFHG